MVQTIAMLVLVWAPWAPKAHKLDLILRDGGEIKAWTILPDPMVLDAEQWARGLNLPAIPTELPIDLVNTRELPSPRMQFFLFWIVGLLVWYLVGRFADDVVQWRRLRIVPPLHLIDLMFAIEATSVAILGVLVSAFDRSAGFTILHRWSAIWFVLASAILGVRIVQIVEYRRRSVVRLKEAG
jgi:hypothetical protein